MGLSALWARFYKTLASIRTGVILLLLTILAAGVGTFILQRPTSDLGQLEKVYSPGTLLWLDRLGLTDIYHSWWFLSLLTLVSMSIIFVSIERWPNSWRFYARPYRWPDSHFRAVLPHHTLIPIRNARTGLEAAERAFRTVRLPVEKVEERGEPALYSEKNRFAVLAVYVIHASLLLIFLGGIIDGMFGYRGFMSVDEGQSSNKFMVRTVNGEVAKELDFSIRCDEARQENYRDEQNRDTRMPKRYWSKLAVVKNGQVVKTKEIAVNDPLDFEGNRIFQASMGQSDSIKYVQVDVAQAGQIPQEVQLKVGEPVPIASDTTLTLARFVPDFYIQDNEVHTKSESPNNPAFGFVVKKAGVEHKAWIFSAMSNTASVDALNLTLTLQGGELANFTGLEVSHQPGQWAVWGGCLLMGVGLVIAMYLIHMRFWVIAVHDEKLGPALWIGGTFNKNKERFEDRYNSLVEAIRREVRGRESEPPIESKKESARETTTVGV